MARRTSSKTQYQSRESRGLPKIPMCSKETKRILKELKKEITFDKIEKRMNALEVSKDTRLARKHDIENILSNKAREIYNKNNGNVCWGAIVRDVKAGDFRDFANNTFNKQSRNENHDFRIKIKRSEISKYEHILNDDKYEVKRVRKTRGK